MSDEDEASAQIERAELTRHESYKARFWRPEGGMELVDYCRKDGVAWPCDVELRDREIDLLHAILEASQ